MLELIRVLLGYCLECRMPKQVGEFSVTGWKHHLFICDTCLQEKAHKVGKPMPPETAPSHV